MHVADVTPFFAVLSFSVAKSCEDERERMSTFSFSLCVVVAWVCAAAYLIPAAEAKKQWIAGFANVSISPTVFHRVCLGGFGECPLCRQAEGVHDDIYARVMYLNLNGDEVTFVSLDIIGMSNLFIQDAIALMEGVVDTDRVIMSSTHSHSTPDLVGLWGWVPESYRTFVLNQVQTAVIAAKKNAQPAILKTVQTSYNITNNRRGWLTTDYGLLAIWALNSQTNELIGLVANFGCHPTVIGSSNHLVSRDWVSGLIDGLEETLGSGKAMYVNAAQGDTSPKADNGADDFERAENYGRSIASTVLQAMNSNGVLTIDTSALYFVKTLFRHCVTNQKFLLAMSVGCMDYDFVTADSTCPPGFPLPSKMVQTQLVYLRLGTQVQLAVIPGESLSRLAVDGVGYPGFPYSTDSIKSVMTAPVHGIWGLSTDFLGYMVPDDEWNAPPQNKNPDNGHYEEGVSLGDAADSWIRDPMKTLILADNKW
jgi:hypothetical protein